MQLPITTHPSIMQNTMKKVLTKFIIHLQSKKLKKQALPDNQSKNNRKGTHSFSNHCCMLLCICQQTETPVPRKLIYLYLYFILKNESLDNGAETKSGY